MAKQPKIKKPIEERMRDCETHLSFLWEARQRYPADRERYKQIAGELRVLVCGFGQNKPLLLDMMDHYGFSYEIQPPGPPFENQPSPLVGWREDPIGQEMTKILEGGDPEKIAIVLSLQAAQRKPIPLRRYVDEGLAVFVRPYDYSFCKLVRAIAEQSGTAHEDDSIEDGVAAMKQVIIGNDHSHIVTLVNFSDTVLSSGVKFLEYMVENHKYRCARFSATN